jgi:hypothetical protein
MAHVHDPENPYPQGTSAYWVWHNKKHPRTPSVKPGPAADLRRRQEFYGGKKP